MLGVLRGMRRRLPSIQRPRRVIVGAIVLAPLVIVVAAMAEAGVRARLDPQLLEPPVVFYARPTVLAPGAPLDPAALEANLVRLGYRRSASDRVASGRYFRGRRTWVIGRRAYRLRDELHPSTTITLAIDTWSDRIASVRSDAGTSLQYATLEPEPIYSAARRGEAIDHVPVRLEDVPQLLVDAVLTIEDKDFFEHEGVDFSRIVGATLANLRAGGIREGASTITQQLAKNLFLSPRRSPLRKVRELFLAIALEERYTKAQILTAYLNVIYLGQNGGLAIHGVGRAAQYYFGRDVSELTLAQAALLAGMIRGPNLYVPARHPKRALERRNLVLRRMHERALIDEPTYQQASSHDLPTVPATAAAPESRYFTDYLSAYLRDRTGDAAGKDGLAVFTSLDLRLQAAATDAVRQELRRLERQYPNLQRASSPLQAALVALVPRTGEILAMVGGRDYGTSQFNRAVHALRQPGSAFKPIVALTALAADRSSDGAPSPFTLATLLDDAPLSVETPSGVWQPVNYDRRFRGAVTLRDALERSLNVPFARLGLAIGPDRIVGTARHLGITSPLQAVPSLALGASEVTPLEMARAYGVLAAQGIRAPLNPLYAAVEADGDILAQFDDAATRVFSDEETFLVTSALLGAVERGTGRGLRAAGYRGSFAAKSGTTNEFRDGWFIGYTPEIVVAVWVGFDDGRSLELPGSRLALPILGRFLAGAFGPEGAGAFSQPWGLDVVEIDPMSGLRGGWGCRGRRELFLPGTAPRESCSPYGASDRFWIRGQRENRSGLMRELLRRLDRHVH